MAAPKKPHHLLTVYARNIDLLTFKRGWTLNRLASELGTTTAALTRVRLRHNKYLDPELLSDLLRVFNCAPNDLLAPHPDVDYSQQPPD